jgi:tripartite motif-containing protein 9/67
VAAQCEALIQLIQERREFLLDTIKMDKESKIRILKVFENIRYAPI